MRYRPLWFVLPILVLVLVACTPVHLPPDTRGKGSSADPRIVGADVLFLRANGALVVLETGSGQIRFGAPGAVPAADWSQIFTSHAENGSTQLAAVETATGSQRALVEVPGHLEARIVSPSGRRVALADPLPPGANLYLPGGRERTTIVVANTSERTEPKRFELEGNYEPEAFSVDDGSLFLIEHLPPLAPERYRVRTLDLASGRVGPLLTRDKKPVPAEEEMRGVGRTQVMAHTGTALYTLYTREPDHLHTRELVAGANPHDEPRAFVHLLSLAQGWAFCLDLPEPFGQGSPNAMALALSPDSQRLYVVDRSTGLLAVADTGALEVLETVAIGELGGVDGGTAAQAGRDGKLYIAGGDEVLVVNTATLDRHHSWSVGEPISGLRISPDGTRLYLGLLDRVAALDAMTGQEIGSFALPGFNGVEHVGALTSEG